MGCFYDKDIGDVLYQWPMTKKEKFKKFKRKSSNELPEKIKLEAKGNPLDNEIEWRKIKINGKIVLKRLIHLIHLWTHHGIF